MNVLDVVIILAYFVGMIALGLIANKKQTGVDDYYLGGRAMGALKIGALWMAGWIGGSSVIGTSSNSYSMGITGIWYVGEIAHRLRAVRTRHGRARQARERGAAEHHLP